MGWVRKIGCDTGGFLARCSAVSGARCEPGRERIMSQNLAKSCVAVRPGERGVRCVRAEVVVSRVHVSKLGIAQRRGHRASVS